ncbi:23S rRNA (adenine(2503)-C(2))-methyltransferase RlmN [Bacteroidales bacterium OttesenSCG-928-K03]|nr:23S rRNA (adenine(2503)-C(2))-methyltransferase RlmN [Odoribacter sp. OttesenSCG-928-L07]MDL2240152.1 23S rRNA (adenine(2503)-C(2))-methyltransferase RlmN [Bacteroidales bacterium OttesenSCG-928-K22]MDL2242976.1 23S rRNA (adenine(2503)-C(2))-methyltransferase RlmN [Bacteroidales bacterium OttesenSCG-928-K03]
MKTPLIGKTLSEIQSEVVNLGLKSYVAKQLTYWIYNKGIDDFYEMFNISKVNQKLLDEHFDIKKNFPVDVKISSDGTKKYLFKTKKENYIESAYIPDEKRHTLCISSEAGCKMGCIFCNTGKQGFQESLSTKDIINQINAIPERDLITNIVFMGMGEPFNNFDNVINALEILTAEYGFKIGKRKITVSTVGIVPKITEFLAKSDCNLAISLHTPFEAERDELMPINKKYPISEILKTLRAHDWGKQRRVSFEYIMFKRYNDSDKHLKELTRILNGMRCIINLISYHSVPGEKFESPNRQAMEEFRDKLSDKGFSTTIRTSRGQDIDAACGLLSTKALFNGELRVENGEL